MSPYEIMFEPAQALPVPSLKEQTTCLNCGHLVPERYCGRCAQDVRHTHRITMRHLLHHLPHSVWHVDKGVLFTLKNIVLHPGATIRAYLAGKRVNHFHPLSLLLLVTGTYAFAFSQLHIPLKLPHDPSVSAAARQMQETFMAVFFKYLRWMYVAMIPCVAACARLFLRRGKFNYAECLYTVAFITAAGNFFALLYLPVSYVYGGRGQLQMANNVLMGAVVLYSTWAYSSMLQHTGLGLPGRLLRGFLTQAGGILVSLLAIILLTLGAYGVMKRQGWQEEDHTPDKPQGSVQLPPLTPATQQRLVQPGLGLMHEGRPYKQALLAANSQSRELLWEQNRNLSNKQKGTSTLSMVAANPSLASLSTCSNCLPVVFTHRIS